MPFRKVDSKLTLSPPSTTVVPYANSLDLGETPINAASHTDPSFLTLRQNFLIYQHWSTFKIEADEKFSRRQFIWRAKVKDLEEIQKLQQEVVGFTFSLSIMAAMFPASYLMVGWRTGLGYILTCCTITFNCMKHKCTVNSRYLEVDGTIFLQVQITRSAN